MDWIEEVWRRVKEDPHFKAVSIVNAFRLPAFTNLKISVTGFMHSSREKLGKLIVENGGCYCKDLSLSCDRLVSNDSTSQKHKFAQKNGITIVKEDWVHDCVRFGARIDEKKYKFSNEESFCEAHVDAPRYDFLLGKLIHLGIGFTNDQIEVLRGLIRDTGALKSSNFSSAVTHYLISGGELTSEDKHRLQSVERCPNIVHYKWLRDSYKSGKCLDISPYTVELSLDIPEDEKQDSDHEIFYSKPAIESNGKKITNLASMSSESSVGIKLRKKTDFSIMSFASLLGSNDISQVEPTSSSAKSNEGTWNSNRAENVKHENADSFNNISQSNVGKQLFAGWKFYTSGFSVQQNRKIASVVAQNGGSCLFQEVKNPSFDTKRVSLIPFSSNEGRNDIAVTELWLEKCLAEEQYIDPYTSPIYRPLSFDTPIKQFQWWSFSITGYEGIEREHLKKLTQKLGGKVTENLTRKNTHLIFKFGEGTKYKKALEWKLKLVDQAWLYDVAREGLSEQDLEVFVKSNESTLEAEGQALDVPVAIKATSRKNPDELQKKDSIEWSEGEDDGRSVASPEEISGLLSGVKICISSKLKHRKNEIRECATSLGAKFLGEGFNEDCSHYLHTSNRLKETFSGFKAAKSRKKFIVSHYWLLQCRDLGKRLPEKDFPHTYKPLKLLEIELSNSNSAPGKSEMKPKESISLHNKENTSLNPPERMFDAVRKYLGQENIVDSSSLGNKDKRSGSHREKLDDCSKVDPQRKVDYLSKTLASISAKRKLDEKIDFQASSPAANHHSLNQGTSDEITYEDPESAVAKSRILSSIKSREMRKSPTVESKKKFKLTK